MSKKVGHRAVFFAAYGFGPHECFFCRKAVMFEEVVVHHINGDHHCDHPYNLAASHEPCHIVFHKRTYVPLAALVADYEAGLTLPELMRKYRSHHTTLRRLLLEAGVTLRDARLRRQRIGKLQLSAPTS